MTVPTIHNNGTCREELVKQQLDAVNALEEAIAAVQRAMPNGRDYYPQGDGAIRRAMEEHYDRLARLLSLQSEYQTMGEKILEGAR
jgi:hypothetical protein